jgi:epsilon-lactone hydrolase
MGFVRKSFVAVLLLSIAVSVLYPDVPAKLIGNAVFQSYRLYYSQVPSGVESRGARSPNVAALDAMFSPDEMLITNDTVAMNEHRETLASLRHFIPVEWDTRVNRAWIDSVQDRQDGDDLNGDWLEVFGVHAPYSLPHLLYLHGGAFVACSKLTHRGVVSSLIHKAYARGLIVDYRLAPEHTLAEALEDAVGAYRYLLDEEGANANQIVVIGDSAGGGLAAALLTELKKRGIKQPAGAVLYSPWLDMTISGDSYRTNAHSDYMIGHLDFAGIADTVARQDEQVKRRFSPATWSSDELKGLAPHLIFASDTEVLLDDAKSYHQLLKKAGVTSRLQIFEHMPHVFPLFGRGPLPEVERALDLSARFIRRYHVKPPRYGNRS